MQRKIKVIVVDDSALVRSLLAEIINRQSDMQCVGAACDPLAAREMIRALSPDVITLDVEMPRMDGLDFLARLMRLRPLPTIMISTLTERSADVTLRALQLGAVDFVTKPRLGLAQGLQEMAAQIVEKIRVAASVRTLARAPLAPARGCAGAAVPGSLGAPPPLGRSCTRRLIGIGASTGGTEAITQVLSRLPADCPPIAITQHMPAGFTASFAARLNNLCALTVQEARNGEPLRSGHAYIAPGGKQFSVRRVQTHYSAVVQDAPPVNRHKPSVEVLFRSIAACAARHAYGIMLTGMGNDGAAAMRQMKDAGSYNLVQDEASCIVFGMPREAIACGAADAVVPLPQIAPALLDRLRCDMQ